MKKNINENKYYIYFFYLKLKKKVEKRLYKKHISLYNYFMKRILTIIFITLLVGISSFLLMETLKIDKDKNTHEEKMIDTTVEEEINKPTKEFDGFEKEDHELDEPKENYNVEIKMYDEYNSEIDKIILGKLYTLKITRKNITRSTIFLDDNIVINDKIENNDCLELKVSINPCEYIKLCVDSTERKYPCLKAYSEQEKKIYYIQDNFEKAYADNFINYIETSNYKAKYNKDNFKLENKRLILLKNIKTDSVLLYNEVEEIKIKINVDLVEATDIKTQFDKKIKLGTEFRIEFQIEPIYAYNKEVQIELNTDYLTKTQNGYKAIKCGITNIILKHKNIVKQLKIEIYQDKKPAATPYSVRLIAPKVYSNGIKYDLNNNRIEVSGPKAIQFQYFILKENKQIQTTLKHDSNETISIYSSLIEINITKASVITFTANNIDISFTITIQFEKR